MAGKDLVYNIGVDASDATKGLKKLESAVKSTARTVESELDDTATAGDKLAQSLDQVASQLKSDFASSAIAAERLQQALKQAGSSLEVGDALQALQRMGLSMDEITQDADKLATSLKQLDDVRAEGVRDLDAITPGLSSKLNDVSKSADSSKSALANMVGNSSQTLADATGVVGDLGVGIGQLGEYFADAKFSGEGLGSVFKNMAGVAGPMVALGLATQGVATALGGIKAEKAFRAGLVDKFTDDMRDAKSVAESLFETLKETGDLDVTVPFSGGFAGLGAEAKSLLSIIDQLGLSWDTVIADINDPGAQDRIRATTADMVFQGDEAEELAVLWNDYALGVDQYGDAWRDASGQQEIANRLLAQGAVAGADAADATAEGTRRTKEQEEILRRQAQAAEDSAEATEWVKDAQEDLLGIVEKVAEAFQTEADALLAQADAAKAAADQQLEVEDAQRRYTEVLKDRKATTDEVRDSAINLADAQAELADQQAAAAGVTLTATERLDNQNSALLNTASTARGPARRGILDYIGAVNQIPPEKVTEIQAAIDRGDLAEAHRLLDEASATRSTTIKADADAAAAKKILDDAAKDRTATIHATVTGSTIRQNPNGSWSRVPISSLPQSVAPAAPAAATMTATSATVPVAPSAAAAAVAPIVVPIQVSLAGIPTAQEIAHRIGRIRLPFSVASGLRADERVAGSRL